MKEAMETMKLIMANPGERQMLEYRHKAEVDRRSWMASARKEGIQEGENRVVKLMQMLQAQGRSDDLNKAINDPNFRNDLFQELKID